MMRRPTGSRCASKRSQRRLDVVRARRASASASASSQAFDTPAPTCGRATKAASPMIGDAAERHARRFQIVDRLQHRLVHQPRDGAELRRHQPLGGGAHRRDRARARISGGGIEIACVTPLSSVSSRCSSVRSVGRPVPDHIVAAMAGPQVVVGPGHRIAEELLAGRQAERHVLEQLAMDRRRNGLLRQQRAPGDVAGIERLEVGQKLLAHGRADAVGADQEIGLRRCGRRLKCAVTDAGGPARSPSSPTPR